MNRNVFEIAGLECSYVHQGEKSKKVVLHIESLSIPMGRVTMILGSSGSGKSTLIETLGLMNNTVEKGLITYNDGENRIAIDRHIWKRPSDLAKIRNRNFSFIFQNDFLMPYYTPEENMLIGMLIRGNGNIRPGESDRMKDLCRRVGLDFEEINAKKPAELSVGQRQRLSFIRAILKDYSVIFGDEPTGNLDETNSDLLMDVLSLSVRQNTRRSAVLVSHNIPLSVAKADYIIVLSPTVAGRYEILSEHVFSRVENGWSGAGGEVLTNPVLAARIRNVVGTGKSTHWGTVPA